MARNQDTAYPPELSRAEALLVEGRRLATSRLEGRPETRFAAGDDAVGFALSGGGIRSATFNLGVFQALAKLGILRRIDYLSTVSGGGYFGSFYGRLFTRKQIKTVADVEGLLRSDARDQDHSQADADDPVLDGPTIVDWLRENGRYLAPRGSGDYLMALAVMLRNWFAVQTVSTLVLLTLLLAMTLPIAYAELANPALGDFTHSLAFRFGDSGWPLWASPLFAVPVLLFFGLLFPLNWAYWISSLRWRSQGMKRWWITHPVAGPLFLVVCAVAAAHYNHWAPPVLRGVLAGFAGLGLFAMLLCLIAEASAKTRGVGHGDTPRDELDQGHGVTKLLSNWMALGLKWTLAFLLLGVIDTLGRTLYALATYGGFTLSQWSGALVALVGLGIARGQTFIGGIAGGDGGKFKLPMRWTASAAGVLLFVLVLVGLDMGAHAIAWQGGPPANLPRAITEYSQILQCELAHETCPLKHQFQRGASLPPASPGDLYVSALVLGVLLIMSLLLGTQWEFLNRSTLQPLYGSRIARAYLGASNPRRHRVGGSRVIDPIAGDDIEQAEYWGADTGPWNKGGPLHLVNVTINETILGNSQIEQQDRHGVGMARGPCGISVGVRHHRLDSGVVRPQHGYRVFGNEAEAPVPESLALSQWAGISGAAFSTGMGLQTSFGLALLTGMLNVRLGYWWDSAIARGRWSWMFAVQRYLLTNEWFARFPGTARRHWYLSDGGHFENTAAYELVRRRLSLMIVSDCGADPGYQFDDVANLVRKARVDFGAEIEFLDAEALRGMPTLRQGNRCYFGSLSEIGSQAKIATWKNEDDSEVERLPCAALASVRYFDDPGRVSWLVLIKPVVHRDDASDLINYEKVNDTFPNETTVDQFYDEAQWESYRKLGESIALRVFAPVDTFSMGDPLVQMR